MASLAKAKGDVVASLRGEGKGTVAGQGGSGDAVACTWLTPVCSRQSARSKVVDVMDGGSRARMSKSTQGKEYKEGVGDLGARCRREAVTNPAGLVVG